MPSSTDSYFEYRTPYGLITISSSDDALTGIALGSAAFEGRHAPSALTNECANQLLEYFAGRRSEFSLPYVLQGTDFQRQVWEAATLIPYGQTRTPSDIAEAIGQPSSYRMVSQAVSKNPLVIVVPAHRIVPSNGMESSNTENAKLRAAFREMERRYA